MALPTLRGDLPAIQRGHLRVATAASVVATVALLPAFLFLAADSTWQPEDLFAVLLSLGFVSYAGAVRLRANVTLDAGFAVALLALVLRQDRRRTRSSDAQTIVCKAYAEHWPA